MSSETVPLDPVPPVPPRRTQLLDLPEELILRIFETVCDELLAERIHGQYENNPFPSRLLFEDCCPRPRQLSRQHFPINSCLHTSLQGVWDRYLALQASEGRTFDDPLSTLSSRIRFLDLANDEEFHVVRYRGANEDADSYAKHAEQTRPPFTFLRSFSGIVTLRATFSEGVPRTFTAALRHLPLLQDLTLQFAHELDDALITLGEATPGLHRLAISAYLSKPLRQLFTNLPSTLKELHIYYTYPHSIPIPWYSVPRLHLYPPKGYFRDPACVIEAFEKVFAPENPREVAVEELTIQVMTLSLGKCEEPDTVYYEEVIPTLLEFMQPTTSIKHLRFFGFGDLRWWKNNIRIDSIECVTLHEHPSGTDYSQTTKRDNLASLPHFLSMFPSLRKLIISGFGLVTDESVSATPIPPGSFAAPSGNDSSQRDNLVSTYLPSVFKILPHRPLRTLVSAIPASVSETVATSSGLLGADKPSTPTTSPSFFFLDHADRLASLLADLQKSRVEEVRYRSNVESEREVRIRREGRGGQWEGEWWDV
ncbi:hypothetical protein NBRC10512v2_003472 [Rhodotorula toruloides]